MTKEPTHIVIDGNKLVISTNLHLIFDFLIKIDEEILSILEYKKKLQKIKDNTSEILKATTHFAKIIQDNEFNLNYEMKGDLLKIGDNFIHNIPTRAELIVIFSYLEVLFSIYVSYECETDNKDDIRDFTMNSGKTRKFISDFVLNIKNDYFNKSKKKLGAITPNNLRDLRNSLNHFYSLGDSGIILIDDNSDKENIKIKSQIKKAGLVNTPILSSKDLYKLLNSSFGLIIEKINNDYKNNTTTFERKIEFTRSIVEKYGAVKLSLNNK